MKLVACITGFLIISSCFTSTRESTGNRIAVRQLKEDLSILRKTLEEAHPGFYWYTPKKEMDAYFDSLATAIDGPMTKLEFLNFLMPAIARVRCSHTRIRLNEELSPDSISRMRLFPLGVAVINNKLYVKESPVDSSLVGLEFRMINSVPIKNIIDRMLNMIPVDGFNTNAKYYTLSTIGFQETYALLYGQPELFTVEAADSTGKLSTFTLHPRSPLDFAPRTQANNSPINLDFIDENKTAILAVNTFVISGESFSSQIATIFERIRQNNATQLIIDVRNNGGGNNANVSRLYSYLAEQPFYHLRRTEMTGRSLTHSAHITNYQQLANMRSTPAPDGTHEVDFEYPGRTLIQPVSQNAFSGKLIVLTNAGTASAASEFVALVKINKRGLIVGEETGGCFYGSTGGRYANLVLPNSELAVTIPMVRIYNAVQEDFNTQPLGRGTIPDNTVSTSPNDLRNNTDKGVETALELFRKQKSL